MNNLTLESTGIGGIFRNSLRLYKNNFIKCVVILFPLQITFFLVCVLSVIFKIGKHSFAGLGTTTVCFVLVLLLSMVYALSAGAIVYLISAAFLNKRIGIMEACKKVTPHVFGLWILMLLSGLIIFGGLAMKIIPGIIFMIFLSFIVPVMIVEKKKTGATMRRSFELVAGSFGKVLTTLLLLALVQIVYMYIMGTGIFTIAEFTGISPMQQLSFSGELINMGIINFFNLLLTPFYMITLISLYYGIKAGKEGFNQEAMASFVGR